MGQRISISFIFYIFLVHSVAGQARFNILPVQFFQTPQNYPLVNPAYAAIDSGTAFTIGNKMNFGSFNIFRTHYLNAVFRIRAGQNAYSGKGQGLGLTVITDKEWDHLQRNRCYLMYAYKIGLSSSLSLSGGASLGFVNHSIESSISTPGGSAMAPDGSIGVWLSGSKAYVGLSTAQIFGNKLSPRSEIAVLQRHINVLAGKRFFIDPNLEYSTMFTVRAAKDMKINIDVVNLLLIQRFLSAGINYRYQNSLVFMAGFENIPVWNGKHCAGGWFSYAVPFKKYLSANIQTYEITLSYKII